jgi:AAA domain
LRIAISGTHCSGKTTLIDAFLVAHPEYVHEPEAYEALQDLCGETFAAEPSAEDFIRQLEYHIAQIHRYRAGDSVVFERSPIDYVAYLQALEDLKRDTANSQLTNRAINLAKDAVNLLDIIVFLRASDVSIEVDEPEDPKLRRAVDGRLESILLDDDLDIFVANRPFVVEALGTTTQRLGAVDAKLRTHSMRIGERP